MAGEDGGGMELVLIWAEAEEAEDGDELAFVAGAAADGEVKAEELLGVGGAEFRAAQVIGGALTADGEFAGLGFRVLIDGFHVLYHPGH